MNEPEPTSSEPPPEPDSPGRGNGPAPEGWLDRLKAAMGLRGNQSIREEIVDALAAGAQDAGFSPEERAMLGNILSLREVRVEDIMVPRADIEAVDFGISLGGLLLAFEGSGHSRMPVHRETLDDPVGLVHIKDLMSHITRLAAVNGGDEDGGKRASRSSPGGSRCAACEGRPRPHHPVRAAVDAGYGAPRLDAGNPHAARSGHRRIWRH